MAETVLVQKYNVSGVHTFYCEPPRGEPPSGDGFGDIILHEIDRETWARYKTARDICDEIEARLAVAPRIPTG